MIALHTLVPAGKDRKRRGRGGDRGGTSGKGNKGQLARSGPSISPRFEGGQMPLTRRIPKRGFNNTRFSTTYEVVNFKDLGRVFEAGETVTKELLIEKGLVKKTRSLVKILANGALDKKLTVHADAFSKAAREGIMKSGGAVVEITKEIAGGTA